MRGVPGGGGRKIYQEVRGERDIYSREPVYDLRTWNEDHTKMGKGVTITAGEMVRLKELLEGMRMF